MSRSVATALPIQIEDLRPLSREELDRMPHSSPQEYRRAVFAAYLRKNGLRRKQLQLILAEVWGLSPSMVCKYFCRYALYGWTGKPRAPQAFRLLLGDVDPPVQA